MIREVKPATGKRFVAGTSFMVTFRPKDRDEVFATPSDVVLTIYNTANGTVTKALVDFTLDDDVTTDKFYYYLHTLGANENVFTLVSTGDVIATDQFLVKAEPLETSV